MGVSLLGVADLAMQGGKYLPPLRAVNSLLDCGSVEFPDAFLVKFKQNLKFWLFEMLTQLGDSVKLQALCSESFPHTRLPKPLGGSGLADGIPEFLQTGF